MKKREIDTAARFGLLDRLQALENDLTAIPGTTYIDFDLSGLYDRCPLCFVVGYDIDVRREDYFEARREWLKAVIMVFLAHDLLRRKLLFCAPHRQDVGGGDPRLIILFILALPIMIIWETAKKS